MRHRMASIFCLLLGTLLVAGSSAIAQPGSGELKLPVPKTFELTHVEPAHYAAALGKDPAKIFAFVRDQIGYEVYTGVLRGPRGTLLAMAGNSVDRAALLASLLEQSGQKVRFARGTLPEPLARALITSMWAERSRPAAPGVTGEPPPAMKAASDTLIIGVKRDYTLIREHLKKAKVTPSTAAAPSLDSLVQEAQEHYWVQWFKDGTWMDLDPSFGDAPPGRKHAPVAETFDVLSDALFHRVVIRIQLEEYTGDQSSSRVILSHATKAADLSGVDLVLSHQPENWKGPAFSLASALASAIDNTSRVKPVLVVGTQPVLGEAFRPKPPTGAGLGGMSDLLSGAGTRRAVPIATAETIEFDFIFPGGRTESVAREIVDVVGKARRAAGKNLTADEVRARTETRSAFDVTQAVYDLFFTTGRIDSSHFTKVEDPPRAGNEPTDIRTGLRRINIMLATISDLLTMRIDDPQRATIRFYLNSPRLSIAEVSKQGDRERITLDLRRDYARAVAIRWDAEQLFLAQVFRGVLSGTLERVLMEYMTAGVAESVGHALSTSLLFERARAEGVPVLLLPKESGHLGAGLSQDTASRLRLETSQRYLAVTPQRAITVAGSPRFAWWRVDSQSGETQAVTDEGLHGSFEYWKVTDAQTGRVERIFLIYLPRAGAMGAVVQDILRSRVTPEAFRTMQDLFSRVAQTVHNTYIN